MREPKKRWRARATAIGARRRAAALCDDRVDSRKRPPVARLAEEMVRLSVSGDPARLAPRLAVALVASALLSLLLAGSAGVAACAGGWVAGYSQLRRSAPRRRARATERALPGVLESVARQLRAGASPAQAISAVAPPVPGELHESWVRLAALVPVVGVASALDDWVAGHRPEGAIRSVRLAGAALALAVTTGGSAARAVDGVAATLRSRLAVAEELRALTSQARASAAVIAGAPALFGAGAAISDPRTAAFLRTGAGFSFLAAGLGLDALGAWWMSRLCRAAE